jgi:tripeptidyl-peptidase-1
MVRALVGFSFGALAFASKVKFQRLTTSWDKGSRGNPSTVLDVMVSLKSRNMDALNSEIMAVSDPSSSRYGQHLTKDEVTALTAPSQQALELVSQWLTDAGIAAKQGPRGDYFEFQASVADLEELFSTTVHEYTDKERSVLQAGDLHTPDEIASVLRSVVGLHGTPYKRSHVGSGAQPVGTPDITPTVLKQVYNVEGVKVSRGSKNRRATAEFQSQYTAQEDLSNWFGQYVDETVFDVQQGDELYTCGPAGGCEPGPAGHKAGTEAMLDIEYIAGIAPGIKNEVWSYQGMAWCTDLKNWTKDILDSDDPPQVFSVSYGIQGNVSLDKNEGCSEEITNDIEDDFAKAAARGVSILVSSGDSGSGGTIWPIKGKVWPSWPASAPHVTAVGSTMFLNNDVSGKSGERSTTQFGSGGGFDCTWAQPTWQRDAVDAYQANPEAGLPREQDFCRGGRGTPDLAALGEGYQVITNGKTQGVGGTSASCPLVAGLISLLNEYRLQNGNSPLGFLNPLLYKMGEAKTGYQDVTVGDNRLDEMSIMKLSEGYSCTEGWDAVTGFGTPNFGQMLDFVKQLPTGQRSATVV